MKRWIITTLIALAPIVAACENKTPSKTEDIEATGEYVKESADGQKSFQNARNAAKQIEGKAADRADRAGEALEAAKGE